MREEWVDEPGVSDHNPKGLPERTIKEVRCSEFGPVTFPAYPGASAAVRSMTDEWLAARMTTQPEPRVREILAYLEQREARTLTKDLPGEEQGPADDVTAEEAEKDSDAADQARSVIDEAEAGAPGPPTPLRGSSTAAPGSKPTPLYSGKSKKRKGWRL